MGWKGFRRAFPTGPLPRSGLRLLNLVQRSVCMRGATRTAGAGVRHGRGPPNRPGRAAERRSRSSSSQACCRRRAASAGAAARRHARGCRIVSCSQERGTVPFRFTRNVTRAHAQCDVTCISKESLKVLTADLASPRLRSASLLPSLNPHPPSPLVLSLPFPIPLLSPLLLAMHCSTQRAGVRCACAHAMVLTWQWACHVTYSYVAYAVRRTAGHATAGLSRAACGHSDRRSARR